MLGFIKRFRQSLGRYDISKYKPKIEKDFRRLKNSMWTGTNFEDKRLAIGLSVGTIFAEEELGVKLDVKDTSDKAINYDGPLNHESKTDLDLVMSVISPERIEDHQMPEVKVYHPFDLNCFEDYEHFFKILYATQLLNKSPDFSEQKKEELIRIGKETLDKIVSWTDREFDSSDILYLKPYLVSCLSIAKEFDEFQVPKEAIDSLYYRISRFEKKPDDKGYSSYDHTRTRLFTEKVILASLNELFY